ncbi:MAG: dephospho-CoA kinase [Deltaproteobacteria bacterium]|nr:dephospho-CoA kinase [Deltaproteobacteria bacterium]MBW2537401.1 dephospho-CoA kinase [Deltaproteobacteria bacterium]
MTLFGLTGGVASGKSTVARRFREQGVPVIDADAVAREVVEPGTEGLAAVVRVFGGEVLGADGALDRARLAAVVFADGAARRQLEQLLHPRIRARAAERAAELGARGVTLGCYEAALLVERGLVDRYRPLVVAALPPSQQLARLMARDGLCEAEARQRIEAQLPLDDKVALADVVVDTAGSLADTARQADDALDAVRAYLAGTPRH